jgi:hypothetical protein
MVPESVEIKVTLAGSDSVAAGIAAFGLGAGKAWSIVFFEDVTQGVGPVTPLLDLGVILRARRKAGSKGDSTVKLRPSRWSQLSDGFSANRENDPSELKIEADWAGPKHVLATALTQDWEDGRLSTVAAGTAVPRGLFSAEQQQFLVECARGRVALTAVCALPAINATRWNSFDVTQDGVRLGVRAERWRFEDRFDFLELSIVSTVEAARRDQVALESLVADRGLTADGAAESKTQRILGELVPLVH